MRLEEVALYMCLTKLICDDVLLMNEPIHLALERASLALSVLANAAQVNNNMREDVGSAGSVDKLIDLEYVA